MTISITNLIVQTWLWEDIKQVKYFKEKLLIMSPVLYTTYLYGNRTYSMKFCNPFELLNCGPFCYEVDILERFLLLVLYECFIICLF